MGTPRKPDASAPTRAVHLATALFLLPAQLMLTLGIFALSLLTLIAPSLLFFAVFLLSRIGGAELASALGLPIRAATAAFFFAAFVPTVWAFRTCGPELFRRVQLASSVLTVAHRAAQSALSEETPKPRA